MWAWAKQNGIGVNLRAIIMHKAFASTLIIISITYFETSLKKKKIKSKYKNEKDKKKYAELCPGQNLRNAPDLCEADKD